ncbi:MAG: hypothetical protein PHV11_06250 [Candidatus Bipolaricaulis sp.]|nr:hypothetical protein [Candidatus Bipolaricaulis sp.]
MTYKELENKIKELEEKITELEKPKPLEKKEEFYDIKFYPLLKVDSLFLKTYNQAAEPTILANSMAFWLESETPAYYLIYNFNGTQKKVALT